MTTVHLFVSWKSWRGVSVANWRRLTVRKPRSLAFRNWVAANLRAEIEKARAAGEKVTHGERVITFLAKWDNRHTVANKLWGVKS